MSNPSTPNIPQSNRDSSLDNSPNGSDKTEKAETKSSPATLQDSNPSGRELGDNDLLEVCLQAVVGLCDEGHFRDMIRAYCDVPGHETKRYSPFTAACNYALERLRALDIPQLRPPSSCEILFHVNDPIHIFGYNQSHRIPDINIVSLETANRVHGLAHGWADFPKDLCEVKPPRRFEWPEVLGFAEFKRFDTIKPQFPKRYDCSLHDPVPPEILRDNQQFPDAASSASATSNVPSSTSTTNLSHSEFNHSQMAASGSGTSLPTTTEGAPGGVPGTTRGVKRLHQGADLSLPNQGGSKKQKGENQRREEGIIQCGSYAAEMLTASAARQHAIGLFIIDDVVWVWWYDRQGPIQSSGINISRDLPLFVVLLFLLQRFSRADWGYNSVLELRAPRGAETDPEWPKIKFPGLEISVHLGDVLHRSFGLVGRGTQVLAASSSGGADRKLVAKLSWPNTERLSEQTIIEQAAKARGVEHHLPKVFASCDGYKTNLIREELGISKNSKRPCRVFRIIILERLYPITAATGFGRITAFVQCVKCHYLAWEAGVQHRDLSLSNLMLREQEGKHLGVLNDWDLSFVNDLSPHVDEHTATLPFLALDLLKPEYWQGKIGVEYRHELESFIWIICWLAKSSESSDGNPPADMLIWKISAAVCRRAKLAYLLEFQLTDRSKATIESDVADSLLDDFSESYQNRRRRERRGQPEPMQEPNKSQLERFLQLVSSGVPVGHQLPHSPVID